MRTTRLTFQQVSATGVRYEIIDGVRRRKQRKFTHTVNPFNRNADGSVKSFAQVKEDVRAEAIAWEIAAPQVSA